MIGVLLQVKLIAVCTFRGVKDMSIIETGFERAKEIIYANVSPYGLMASTVGYRQVWARDLGISALGAALLNVPEISASILTSLLTLKEFQAPSGAIPIFVSVTDPPRAKFGVANGSGIDATMWYIMTLYYLWRLGKLDQPTLQEFAGSIERAAWWLRCQDSNEDHLLEVPENSDWRDLWFYRQHVLYDDVLYYATSRAIEEMNSVLNIKTLVNSSETKFALNLFYWISIANWQKILQLEKEDKLTQPQIGELYSIISGTLENYPYYLPYVAISDYGLECDVVGNVLAILFSVADKEQEQKILDYLSHCGAADPYPIAVLDMPVQIAERRWHPWFAKAHLNLPYQYHNGGIWLFAGGLYVASLVKAGRLTEAQMQLERLAKGASQGKTQEWEFNEWLHKLTGKPMGSPKQLWSAAMYCYAYRALSDKKIAVFQDWQDKS